MKKRNWGRVIWVTALFLLLIVILLMVMDYKIHYQYLTPKRLYFYECDGNLCVTEVEDETKLMYSKYECPEEECPIFKGEIGDEYALLENKNTKKVILYNYRSGQMISDQYEHYIMIDSKHIIVLLGNNQGIITEDNKIIVPVQYEQIGYEQDGVLLGYNFQYIIAKKNGKYGIVSYKDGTIIEDFQYTDENINSLLEKLKEEPAEE